MRRKDQRNARLVMAVGFLTWGVSMLMRTSFGYFVEELSLSAAQVGVANAVAAATVCVSAIAVGALAERAGKIFPFLSALLVIAAAAVATLAQARSYGTILASRVLLGIGCGPLFALTMKSVRLSSTANTYPRNAGVVSNGEAIINTIFGPVILVFLLSRAGFARTNYLFAGLLVALAGGWLAVNRRMGAAQETPTEKSKTRLLALLKNGNLMKCLFSGALALVACWCVYMYAPTLLTNDGHLSDAHMSYMMTAMGVFMAVWMVALPACYSALKRKTVVTVGCLLGALGIGALTVNPESWISLGLFVLFGGCASVMSLFFMAILSVECVDAAQSASALALVNGGCELLGASLGPMAAGWIADRTELKVSLLVASGCLVCAGIITLCIHSKDNAGQAPVQAP